MDVFPLPRVDDSLDLLANSTFFTTLDLATGYWQVKVIHGKLKQFRPFQFPTTSRGLRSFLGLASYYRRFIQNFSVIANPLYALTRKDAVFDWSPACQEAFDRLKMVLTNAPLLAFPDFNRDFLLETDASGIGLGAVLAQKQADGSVRPIAFASRTLQKHEKNYGITEMEALGVVWAVKHFRPYLYGHGCDVYTDHEALKSLLNTPQPSGKLARWGMALQELDLRISLPARKKQLECRCIVSVSQWRLTLLTQLSPLLVSC